MLVLLTGAKSKLYASSSIHPSKYRQSPSAMAVVASVGFGIAIVQARTILTSIEDRMNKYRKGPETFRKLRESVNRLKTHIEEVETLIETFPSTVPSEISTTFGEKFAAVRDTLESADASMEGSFSTAFAGGSSMIGKIKSKMLRTFRATKLSDEMNSLEVKNR